MMVKLKCTLLKISWFALQKNLLFKSCLEFFIYLFLTTIFVIFSRFFSTCWNKCRRGEPATNQENLEMQNVAEILNTVYSSNISGSFRGNLFELCPHNPFLQDAEGGGQTEAEGGRQTDTERIDQPDVESVRRPKTPTMPLSSGTYDVKSKRKQRTSKTNTSKPPTPPPRSSSLISLPQTSQSLLDQLSPVSPLPDAERVVLSPSPLGSNTRREQKSKSLIDASKPPNDEPRINESKQHAASSGKSKEKLPKATSVFGDSKQASSWSPNFPNISLESFLSNQRSLSSKSDDNSSGNVSRQLSKSSNSEIGSSDESVRKKHIAPSQIAVDKQLRSCPGTSKMTGSGMSKIQGTSIESCLSMLRTASLQTSEKNQLRSGAQNTKGKMHTQSI